MNNDLCIIIVKQNVSPALPSCCHPSIPNKPNETQHSPVRTTRQEFTVSLSEQLVRDRTHSDQLVRDRTHSEQFVRGRTHSEQLIRGRNHCEQLVRDRTR